MSTWQQLLARKQRIDDTEGEPKLSIREICISEEIQCELAPIIIGFLDEKRAVVDALEWILSVVRHDERSKENLYGISRAQLYELVINTKLRNKTDGRICGKNRKY